jgi:hypothetical protein
MLNLRIVRSPLSTGENEAILKDYNRLTAARIPIEEFVRWVQDGPSGPACHALLETDEKRIVGHTSLIPLRVGYGTPEFTPAKSEYSFVHEDFRSTPIRGYEEVKRPKFLILVDQLFRHGQSQGWGPFLVSTRDANHPLSRRVGCRAAEFPLWECLLVLRPVRAARHTPNVSRKQRAALLAAGIAQRALWSGASWLLTRREEIQSVPIGTNGAKPQTHRLSFFEDPASMKWRYQTEQYVKFGLCGASGDYVIAKRGSKDRYLRVCQWRLAEGNASNAVIRTLIREAQDENAIGVRWAVYEDGPVSSELVTRMRKHGFLCAPRVRTVMIHTKAPEFLAPAMWHVNDAMFSFDP